MAAEKQIELTEVADGEVDPQSAQTWLAEHPELADELEIARRVRRLMIELRAAEVQLPADFEQRVMERVRADAALLNLLDLWFSGLGVALLELLDAFFALLPQPQPTLA
jgi:hypothetical protein